MRRIGGEPRSRRQYNARHSTSTMTAPTAYDTVARAARPAAAARRQLRVLRDRRREHHEAAALRVAQEPGDVVGAECLERVGLEQPDDAGLRGETLQRGPRERHLRGEVVRRRERRVTEAVTTRVPQVVERGEPAVAHDVATRPGIAVLDEHVRPASARRACGSRRRRDAHAFEVAPHDPATRSSVAFAPSEATTTFAPSGPAAVTSRRARSGCASSAAVSDCTVAESSAHVAPRAITGTTPGVPTPLTTWLTSCVRSMASEIAFRTSTSGIVSRRMYLRPVARVVDRDAVKRFELPDVGAGNAAHDVDLFVRERVDQRRVARIRAEHDLEQRRAAAWRPSRSSRPNRSSSRRRARLRRRRRAGRVGVEVGRPSRTRARARRAAGGRAGSSVAAVDVSLPPCGRSARRTAVMPPSAPRRVRPVLVARA